MPDKEAKLYFIMSVSALDFKMKEILSSFFKSISILAYVYITITAFVLIPTVSLINELINNSEERSLPIEIDYGIDIQEYFYYLFIPLYISMFIVPHVIASCDSTYLLYVHHASALFAMVR